MNQAFQNRKQAGDLLAEQLNCLPAEDKENAIILALPRGGIPVGFEVAQALNLPLEILIVRKIGHPLQPEYGIGALAEDGFYWIDPDAVKVTAEVTPAIKMVIEKEKKEIERRVEKYRHNRPLPPLKGKTVILVDDGLATGVTARVAAKFVRAKGARKIILAVPVCSDRTAEALRKEIDQVFCVNESAFFMSVGQFYQDFKQLSDKEVMSFLDRKP